jgi:hypothetical protein
MEFDMRILVLRSSFAGDSHIRRNQLQIARNEIGADLTSSGQTTIGLDGDSTLVCSQNLKTAVNQPVVFTLTGLEGLSRDEINGTLAAKD